MFYKKLTTGIWMPIYPVSEAWKQLFPDVVLGGVTCYAKSDH